MGRPLVVGFLFGNEKFAAIFTHINIVASLDRRAHSSGDVNETAQARSIFHFSNSKSVSFHQSVEPVKECYIQFLSDQIGLFLQLILLSLRGLSFLDLDFLEFPQKARPADDFVILYRKAELDFIDDTKKFCSVFCLE